MPSQAVARARLKHAWLENEVLRIARTERVQQSLLLARGEVPSLFDSIEEELGRLNALLEESESGLSWAWCAGQPPFNALAPACRQRFAAALDQAFKDRKRLGARIAGARVAAGRFARAVQACLTALPSQRDAVAWQGLLEQLASAAEALVARLDGWPAGVELP